MRGRATSRRLLNFFATRFAAPLLIGTIAPADAATLTGDVEDAGQPGTPIEGTRITLFTPDLDFFREERTDASGHYEIVSVPDGEYVLGAAARGFEYTQGEIEILGAAVGDFSLDPETHQGRWTIIGDTDPENLFATDSGTLLPDGRIFFCHDTVDPLIFDPLTGEKSFPTPSPSQQGCHISTLLDDGRVAFIGGQQSDDFRDATKTVKAYDPVTDEWEVFPDLNEERWYPGMVRLGDGRLLAMGGGQSPNAQRTPTCEIYDPQTRAWTPTGDMSTASDFPPSVLLFTDEVLRSWYPPQLYNLDDGQWRDTGLFVQPERFWPGHCDHSLLLLKNGEALVCGVYRGELQKPSMVELYDPSAGTWRMGATPEVTRSQPEAAQLPTGHVLCAGGKLEDDAPEVPTNEWGQTKVSDLYDPAADSWRSMEDMFQFREYHALTLLIPDGRVVVTAGTGPPAGPGISNDVEAFEPPYLFRGVRPRIDALSSTVLPNGSEFQATVALTEAVTEVVLIGTSAVTHWVDGGIPRLVSLPFNQAGTDLIVTVPSSTTTVPAGWYILFALVDDIPSKGVIIRVPEAGAAGVGDLTRDPLSMRAAPNPFRSGTRLQWTQPRPGSVSVRIHDAAGRLVFRQRIDHLSPGRSEIAWTGRDQAGRKVAGGVFWARIDAAGHRAAAKVVIAR